MLTKREHCELRAFYARFPFDDEANHHLPIALLRSQIFNMFKGEQDEAKSAIDFLPFQQAEKNAKQAKDTGAVLANCWNNW